MKKGTSLILVFVTFFLATKIWPLDIELIANHKQKFLSIPPDKPIDLSLSIYPDYQGARADRWIAASTTCCGWFWFDGQAGWVSSQSPILAYQGPLRKIENAPLLRQVFLPEGTYIVYAGIDLNPNGQLDFSLLRYQWLVIEVTNSPQKLALEYLRSVMDTYHYTFDVYTDLSAAGNHFVMLARMGNNVNINPSSKRTPLKGATCIENVFTGKSTSWGGWYFMNGVLLGEDIVPRANWGDYPNAGINLTGAKKLTFWARGARGGEKVEFFAFGIGRDPSSGKPLKPYPDSSPKVTICGLLSSPCFITLSTEWKQYTIDLQGLDLDYVLGGFGWVTNAPSNDNQSVIFYLDNIRYHKRRLNEPRFLVSFQLLPSDPPELINTAFTYDNALALSAFLASETEDSLKRAKLLGDALVYALEHDRFFTDGRLRNAYQGGDLALPPGWEPHGKKGTVRMPGWWDETGKKWYEDRFAVSTHTGNVAWAMIALLNLYERTKEDQYLQAALKMGEWIETNCRDERGAGGYTGGYEGWEPTATNSQGQTKLLWKSTEHNIDVFVAFERLYQITGNQVWQERAHHAQKFVEAMWDSAEGHFWTGTADDGVNINKTTVPVDIQAWGVLGMGSKYYPALEWAKAHCLTQDNGFLGFDFNDDLDGVWFEGTAQMALALKKVRDPDAEIFLQELERAQKEAPNTDGYGLVAASRDGVSTGFTWSYNARLHVGATAWFIFAELGYNPYWNKPVSDELD